MDSCGAPQLGAASGISRELDGPDTHTRTDSIIKYGYYRYEKDRIPLVDPKYGSADSGEQNYFYLAQLSQEPKELTTFGKVWIPIFSEVPEAGFVQLYVDFASRLYDTADRNVFRFEYYWTITGKETVILNEDEIPRSESDYSRYRARIASDSVKVPDFLMADTPVSWESDFYSSFVARESTDRVAVLRTLDLILVDERSHEVVVQMPVSAYLPSQYVP